MIVLSDREEAIFQLQFADENRLPLDVTMAEFIDVKSAKARGKRLSNYNIANIIDVTPAPPEPEPEPEPEPNTEEGQDNLEQPEQAEITETTDTTDKPSIPFTITNGESDVQLSLDL